MALSQTAHARFPPERLPIVEDNMLHLVQPAGLVAVFHMNQFGSNAMIFIRVKGRTKCGFISRGEYFYSGSDPLTKTVNSKSS